MRVVEVAGGPGGGGCAEVGEDGVEVGEIDGAVGVGVAEEFGGDEEGVGVDGLAAELITGALRVNGGLPW